MHVNVTAGFPSASLYHLLWWRVTGGAAPLERCPRHLSRALLFGRNPKNQSCRPRATASHYQSHLLTFVFTLSSCSIILPSCRLFNCHCLLLSLLLCFSMFLFLMYCAFYPVFLPLSHYCSSISPQILYSMWQKAVLQESAIFIIQLVHFIH